MIKHTNKVLIFIINALLMVIGVFLIKDYSRSRADSASNIDPVLEPLSVDNADVQTADEAIDLPTEPADTVNDSQNTDQNTANQTITSPAKNVKPASVTTSSSSQKKTTSKTSSSSSTSAKKSSTPKTKTS